MPAPDTFELLRRLDPAAGLASAEPEARDQLRRSIVATPVRQEPRGIVRRRGRLALAVAGLALVLAAAGWGLGSSLLDTAETVRSDFDEVTATIPLPPGAAWSDPNLDEAGFYGEQAALMMAQWQATCAWFEYWKEGDAAERAEALAGFERLRATMQPRRPGALEDEAGHHSSSLRAYDAAIAEMKRGEPTLVRQYLRANC
jgi:hypothetical protein